MRSTLVPTLPRGHSHPDAPSSGPGGGHSELGPGWEGGLCAVASARDLRAPPLDPTSHLADGKVEALGGQGQSKVTLQVARGSRAQARGNFHKPTGA